MQYFLTIVISVSHWTEGEIKSTRIKKYSLLMSSWKAVKVINLVSLKPCTSPLLKSVVVTWCVLGYFLAVDDFYVTRDFWNHSWATSLMNNGEPRIHASHDTTSTILDHEQNLSFSTLWSFITLVSSSKSSHLWIMITPLLTSLEGWCWCHFRMFFFFSQCSWNHLLLFVLYRPVLCLLSITFFLSTFKMFVYWLCNVFGQRLWSIYSLFS